MATAAAAISSGYFGSVQGLPTRLAPAASRRNKLLLRCSASGGDGAGGPDPVLEEQKRRRAKLSARASLFRWLAKLGPPGALAAGLLKAAGVGATRRGPELPAGSLAAGDAIFLPLYIIHHQGRRPNIWRMLEAFWCGSVADRLCIWRSSPSGRRTGRRTICRCGTTAATTRPTYSCSSDGGNQGLG